MSLPQIKAGSKIKDYHFLKELGSGCFGRVYEAVNLKNNETIAIKCVSKTLKQSSPKAFQLFQAEKTILSKINNNNVIGFVDYFEANQAEKTILSKINNNNVIGFVDYFEAKEICFLCIEYCNEGDLEDYLKTKPGRRIPESEAVEYYKQILAGFQALHEQNILHRDLKLPNILKHNGELKLADFGFSKELKDARQLTGTILGTPYTMAPEILEEKNYGLSCDIYSLGVNFYQMVFGSYPFDARSESELVKKIQGQLINFNKNGVKISRELQDLLSRMLKYNIKQRITMPEIWEHPLFEKQIQSYNMANLHASRIDIGKMADYYKSQKQQKQNQQNPFDQNLQTKPSLQQIEDFKEPESPNNHLIMEQHQKAQQTEKQIKDLIQNCYLHEINTINQLGICVNSCCFLPPTQINTFYPCYFALKKLVHYQQVLLKDMEMQKNIFNCQHPNLLFNHNLFKQMKNQLNTQKETNYYNYLARKFEMEDLMQQTPNPDIIKEIDHDAFDQNSEVFYKQTLINYYIGVTDEMNKYIKVNNMEYAESFQKHLVEILDILDLQSFFRSQHGFDFGQYQEFKESLNFQQRQQLIEKKAKIVFRS
ncbi:Protein kinase-like domain [Pseudocohnilembus persalinus]|uniref:Protein kinase-like domain n=1 Tax=Pseudocohnilembus persalinus TaxID=266149 RepID=A0A0V0QUH0_PSEPJ|nr:Protein kinase-like domain [Pseudocohnilembus persalinus]|eukprot:KRX05951.1 Protein kinase-like domain [Pseudocohnilembus persalinus]